MEIKVLLVDQVGVTWDVSYIQEIPMSLNFAIADVRNPDKRNTTFSKTIVFPATPEINRFFRSIWQCSISLLDFDPNLKCAIYYYIDNVEQLRGDLQLLKINVDGDGAPLSYETAATGRLGNLFLSIADGYLTDLDFSAYDHTLNKANVKASWIATPGSGYLYGLINYGLNQVNTESEYHVKHMRPQIYKKEILDKIFAAAGKTYTSTYFNSNYFKRQVIPASNETITLSSLDIDNSQFYARRNANQTGTNNSTVFSGAWSLTSLSGAQDVVLFNEDNVVPYHDTGAQYDTSTGIAQINYDNAYNLTSILYFDIVFANTLGTATHVTINAGRVYVEIQKFNGVIWNTVVQEVVFINAVYPSLTVSAGLYVNLPNNFNIADQYRVVIYPYSFNFDLFDAGNIPITTGTTTVTPVIKTDSTYFLGLQSTIIQEGFGVEVNQALPVNVKQVDWLMSEFKAANIYMDVDKNNDNNYIIEPREDFYSGVVDWSDKFDEEIDHEVYPMGDLNFKRKEYSYKADVDQFNEDYFKSFKEVYGFKFLDINNNFIQPTIKTELIYSPTPLVGNSINGLVVPYIQKFDNGVISSLKSNIRSLYYGGVINLSFGSWTLKSASGDEVLTTYPFIGDCDNPYNPTFTLLWDTPHQVYYDFPTATFTDNNLYNRYYLRQDQQTTDKNSKIVKAYFTLSKSDIQDFDFRKTVYVGKPLDAYFIVNSIPNYDVLNPKSTMVELLKLQHYNAFTPSTIGFPTGGPTITERISNGNYSNGLNNTNRGSNSHIVGGSGNYISAGAQDVNLRNCTNVIVQSDVTGFTGDGLSNRTITSVESNTVSKQNSPSVTLDATTNNTIDASFNGKLVFIDGSLGGFTITGDTANMVDCDITFKRIDGTGAVIQLTDVDATKTIDGAALAYTFSALQWSKIKISWDGINLFITG